MLESFRTEFWLSLKNLSFRAGDWTFGWPRHKYKYHQKPDCNIQNCALFFLDSCLQHISWSCRALCIIQQLLQWIAQWGLSLQSRGRSSQGEPRRTWSNIEAPLSWVACTAWSCSRCHAHSAMPGRPHGLPSLGPYVSKLMRLKAEWKGWAMWEALRNKGRHFLTVLG